MMERPDLFVIGRLLEGLLDGPLKRTQLQQRAGLNYTVFLRYFDYLVYLGLIAADADGGQLRITGKGTEAQRFLSEGLYRIFAINSRA